MARHRFGSGTYRLEVPTLSATAQTPIYVDGEKFTILKDTTTDINCNTFWSYDDSLGSLTINKIPSNPVTITQSVGGEARYNPKK